MVQEQDKLFDVAGRVVVVTGGMGLLGSRFSRELVRRGARVAVFDALDNEALWHQRLGEEAEAATLRRFCVDITDRGELQAALEAVSKEWQTPYGLINTAAIDSPPDAPAEENGPFETYPEASWDKVMEVNVKGSMMACQVIGGAMASAGRGSIVNICSTYGLVGPDQRVYEYRRTAEDVFYKPVSYSASKSAILNLTRYLAVYWAERGVRVNTLTFGGVFNHQDERFLAEYARRTPLGRMADHDEYNGAVIFLLSDAASYMTGANMVLDGGWTAW